MSVEDKTSQSTFRAMLSVLREPATFFSSTNVKGTTSLRPSAKVAFLSWVISAIVISTYALTGVSSWPKDKLGRNLSVFILLVLKVALLWPFVYGGLLHLIARAIGGTGSYKQSVAITYYSMAVLPVSCALGIVPIPSVGLVAWAYGFVIAAIGTVAIHQTIRRKTYIAFAIAGMVILGGLSIFTHSVMSDYQKSHPAAQPPAK